MMNNTEYVGRMSDSELYKALQDHGFSYGPVVASTRELYRRKLIQILDAERSVDNEHDDMGEASSRPIGRHSFGEFTSSVSNISRRSDTTDFLYASNESEAVVDPSEIHLSFAQNAKSTGKRSRWTISSRPRQDDNAGPSWLAADSNTWAHYESPQNDSIPRSESYGKSRHSMFAQLDDDTPGYAIRHRTSLPGLSAANRYREPGFSSETSMQRRNQDRQQKKSSFSTWIWICLFTVIILASIGLLYMVYNAWFENDPYQQIEEDVRKFIEKQETMKKDPEP